MSALLEVTLSWVFANAKGRDAKLFDKGPAFKDCKEPTIPLTSPDCGPSPAQFREEYTADGEAKFPELEWTVPAELQGKVKEWLLVSEDPDAPLPKPISHGVFGGIAAETTKVTASDFELVDESKALLKGGFHYTKTRRDVPYVPPRPLLNHGAHRYFYMIVALSQPVSTELLSNKETTREQIAEDINGKVLGWGQWIASYERRWK